MSIENSFGNNVIVSANEMNKLQYKSMTEPEKDFYKCSLNPLFKKIIPDDSERMSKVAKVIEEMQYWGLSYEDVVKKYNLPDEVKKCNVDR